MLAHKPADRLRGTNSSLTNNDDSKEAHALHEMGFLEAQHAPAARDS